MKFSVRTHIAAKPDVVWALLTDAAGYPGWNSTVVKIDGTIAEGERIALVATVNPKRAFNLTVEALEPNRRMVWSDGMPLGLFRGARTYELVEKDGGTEFSMEEVFTGLMAPLITKMIPDLQPSFDQWGADLKARAEQG
ncbi:MAG: SRPBCC domain-containing protein [Myxococcota bacterium]